MFELYLNSIVIGLSLGVIIAFLMQQSEVAAIASSTNRGPILPAQEKCRIKDLAVGDFGMVMPWMLFRDEAGNFFVWDTLKLYIDDPRCVNTTLRMKVERTRRGLTIDLSACEDFQASAIRTPYGENLVAVRKVTGAPGLQTGRVTSTKRTISRWFSALSRIPSFAWAARIAG